MQLHVVSTKQYKKSLKKLVHSGKFEIRKLEFVINQIANRKQLSKKHKDHSLKGNLSYLRECHIQPDILLVYQVQDENLLVVLVNVGSHAELFE